MTLRTYVCRPSHPYSLVINGPAYAPVHALLNPVELVRRLAVHYSQRGRQLSDVMPTTFIVEGWGLGDGDDSSDDDSPSVPAPELTSTERSRREAVFENSFGVHYAQVQQGLRPVGSMPPEHGRENVWLLKEVPPAGWAGALAAPAGASSPAVASLDHTSDLRLPLRAPAPPHGGSAADKLATRMASAGSSLPSTAAASAGSSGGGFLSASGRKATPDGGRVLHHGTVPAALPEADAWCGPRQHDIALFTSRKALHKELSLKLHGRYLLQKYIEKPLLLMNERKMDLRLYIACIQSDTGCEVFTYHDSLVRTASRRFNLNIKKPRGFTNAAVHNTSTAAQLDSKYYGRYEEGNCLTLQELQHILDFQMKPPPSPHVLADEVLPQMQQIALDAVTACFCPVTVEALPPTVRRNREHPLHGLMPEYSSVLMQAESRGVSADGAARVLGPAAAAGFSPAADGDEGGLKKQPLPKYTPSDPVSAPLHPKGYRTLNVFEFGFVLDEGLRPWLMGCSPVDWTPVRQVLGATPGAGAAAGSPKKKKKSKKMEQGGTPDDGWSEKKEAFLKRMLDQLLEVALDAVFPPLAGQSGTEELMPAEAKLLFASHSGTEPLPLPLGPSEDNAWHLLYSDAGIWADRAAARAKAERRAKKGKKPRRSTLVKGGAQPHQPFVAPGLHMPAPLSGRALESLNRGGPAGGSDSSSDSGDSTGSDSDSSGGSPRQQRKGGRMPLAPIAEGGEGGVSNASIAAEESAVAQLRAELAQLRQELGALKSAKSQPDTSKPDAGSKTSTETPPDIDKPQEAKPDEAPPPPVVQGPPPKTNPYKHRGWSVLIRTVLDEYRFKLARTAKLEGELARRLANLAAARSRIAAQASEERAELGLPPLKGLDRLAAIKPGVRPLTSPPSQSPTPPLESAEGSPPPELLASSSQTLHQDHDVERRQSVPRLFARDSSSSITSQDSRPTSPRRKTPPRPPSLLDRADVGPDSELVRSLEQTQPPLHTPSPSRKDVREAALAARGDRLAAAAASQPPPSKVELPLPQPAYIPPANLPPTRDLGPLQPNKEVSGDATQHAGAPALPDRPPPPTRAELRTKAETERAAKQRALAEEAAHRAAASAKAALPTSDALRGFPN